MSNHSSKKDKNSNPKKDVRVLCQNLGGSLYAFTEINGQIFFGKVPVKQSTKDLGSEQSNAKKNRNPKGKSI